MKWLFLLLTSLVCIAKLASAEMLMGSVYVYAGDFKVLSQQGVGCGEFFVPSRQIARLHFVGANSRTIVVNMRSDSGQQGPLLGLNLVGLYGSGDFKVERSGMDVGRKLTVVMEGLVDSSFMAAELTVQRFDAQGNLICSAKGDYYGSPGL